MPEHDPDDIPTDDPRPDELRRAPSLVLVNTGPGKGKTTAAMGVVIRGVGRGWPVAVVQFLKSGRGTPARRRCAASSASTGGRWARASRGTPPT